MAYLGINIHDNVVLSAAKTKINEYGGLDMNFKTKVNTDDVFAAMDGDASIEEAENVIKIFALSTKAWDGKPKTPVATMKSAQDLSAMLREILKMYMTEAEAKAALGAKAMFIGLGITPENQGTLKTRFADAAFVKVVSTNIFNGFLTAMAPFFDGEPFRIKFPRQSEAKPFPTLCKFVEATPWIEPMLIPKSASKIEWTAKEIEKKLNTNAKLEVDAPTGKKTANAAFGGGKPMAPASSPAPAAPVASAPAPVVNAMDAISQ